MTCVETAPDPTSTRCDYRVDKDIPAGPGPWVCDLPSGHPFPPAHHLVQEHKE